MERRIPVEPFPPGEYISEMMEEKGWTQEDLAEVLGRTRNHVGRLLGGQTGITPDTAHELAKAFGTSPELWMNLQTSFELAAAAKEDRDIQKRSRLYSKVPVREISKRGWLRDVATVDELEREVCLFLEIDSLDDQPQMFVAAKQSTSYSEPANAAQIAWFCRVRSLARCVQAAPFDQRRFEQGLVGLRELAANAEDIRRVPRFLAELGVRLVLVQHLKDTLIDGVAMWLNDQSPVVGLSTRFNRIDNFWHTLFHELTHIKYHDESPIDSDIDGVREDEPEMEVRANREAADCLVPAEKLDSFIRRTRPLYYQTKIVQFAQARDVHPGVVVGQLQRRKELDYKQLRKLLVPVRDDLVGNALADGWGHAPMLAAQK